MSFFSRGRKVLMLVSVGDHEAGKTFNLPTALADEYVAKGYAQGKLSRPFSDQELNLLRANDQVVNFSG